MRGYSWWGRKVSDMNERVNSKTKILHGDGCFSCLAETSRDRRNVLPLSVQSVSSVAQSCPVFATPWTAACQAPLFITNARSYSNSCPLSRSCHPTISTSVIPFSRFQSFPASGSFPMSQLFASGGQKYWSFSFSISPSN